MCPCGRLLARRFLHCLRFDLISLFYSVMVIGWEKLSKVEMDVT